MKTIKIVGTNVTIEVSTAEEMHMIFFRLHPWAILQVDDIVYPADKRNCYTVNYFQAKYFA